MRQPIEQAMAIPTTTGVLKVEKPPTAVFWDDPEVDDGLGDNESTGEADDGELELEEGL